jgi:hypothetical protein
MSGEPLSSPPWLGGFGYVTYLDGLDQMWLLRFRVVGGITGPANYAQEGPRRVRPGEQVELIPSENVETDAGFRRVWNMGVGSPNLPPTLPPPPKKHWQPTRKSE